MEEWLSESTENYWQVASFKDHDSLANSSQSLWLYETLKLEIAEVFFTGGVALHFTLFSLEEKR